MSFPTVSVIIPVFNREHYISQTIRSVLEQTFGDYELIVINDGSTDGSDEVIKGFTDPRIAYIEQKNMGLAATWNVGLHIAEGDFIKLLDSDDYLAPSFIAEHQNYFQQHPEADMVYSNWYYVDEASNITGKHCLGKVEGLYHKLLLGNMFGVHEMLFRRECIASVGFFDVNIRVCEDWDLYIRLARSGYNFMHLDKYLSYHRVHTGTYKKVVTDRFRWVLDKTFSDETLAPEYRSLKEVSEARHALVLLEDCCKWQWWDEIDACLERLVSALNRIEDREDALQTYAVWIVPTWPPSINLVKYALSYRKKLRHLGVDQKLIYTLDLFLVKRFLFLPRRFAGRLFIRFFKKG